VTPEQKQEAVNKNTFDWQAAFNKEKALRDKANSK
jgi:hypothetical protein